jgi:hypothetical protein
MKTQDLPAGDEVVGPYPVREVYGHEINRANQMLVVSAGSEGAGNAAHDYWINDTYGLDSDGCPSAKVHIHFQEGPIAEAGLNGITNETLLAVLIDRMKSFQAGPYSCRENAIALTHMEDAMHWLHHRTHNRVHRGVEGTSKV